MVVPKGNPAGVKEPKDLTKARTFKTRGSATAACSANERPIDVEYLLQRPRN